MQDNQELTISERSELNIDAIHIAQGTDAISGGIFSHLYVQIHELLSELKALDNGKSRRIEAVLSAFTNAILHTRRFDFIANAHIVQHLTGITASNLHYYRTTLFEEGKHYVQLGNRYYYSNAVLAFFLTRDKLLVERLSELQTKKELEKDNV